MSDRNIRERLLRLERLLQCLNKDDSGTGGGGGVATNLYLGDGAIPATSVRSVSIPADSRLNFAGGTVVDSMISGGFTSTSGNGQNPIGFGSFGYLNALNTPNTFDSFFGNFEASGEPRIDAQVYNNTDFLEKSGYFLGTLDFGGTTRPYGALYYSPDNINFIGFESSVDGERLYSQRGGLVPTALAGTEGILFTDANGIIRAASITDLLSTAPNLYNTDGTLTSSRIVTIPPATTFRFVTSGADIIISAGGNVAASNSLFTVNRVDATASGGYSINGDGGMRLYRGGESRWYFKARGTFPVMSVEEFGKKGVSITGAATENPLPPTATLSVRGEGNSDATDLVNFEALAGNDRFNLKDNGYLATGSGIAAAHVAGFTQFHRASGESTGFGFYSYTDVANTILVQNTGSLGGETAAIRAGFQGVPTGIARGVYGTSTLAGPTQSIGVAGNARNGSQYSIAIDGVIPGGVTVTSSIYTAAVRGTTSATRTDGLYYGGYFIASQTTTPQQHTEDIIGVEAIGVGVNNVAGQVGIIVGGKFRTGTSGGTNTINTNIALLVPSSLNDGNVVFGADQSSTNNSMLEVTGDIELMQSANGVILTAPDSSRWKITVDNTGVLTTTVIP